MSLQISNEIFADYLKCEYKAYLKLHDTAGHETEYERLMDGQDAIYRSAALKKLQKDYSSQDILHIARLTPSSLKQGCSLIVDASVEIGGLRSAFHAVKISAKTPCVYEPVLCCRFRKISRKQKLLLTYMAIVLGRLQGKLPTHGYIIYGNRLLTSKVLLKHYVSKADAILQALNAQPSATDEMHPFLNDHCDICEFSQHCRDKALDCDHLSLLRGISLKEIKRHNDRGIFTVHQLSYTFRPRKTPKRAKNPGKPHHFSLQALALRENRIYIHGTPELLSGETDIYFDIEGLPDKDFYYLIGVIVAEKGGISHDFFWADYPQEERGIFARFIESIHKRLPNAQLFHFGAYEMAALKQMKKHLSEELQTHLDAMINRSVNVLSIVHSHVYFPTYSNGLKDIGNILGCKWTDSKASGIQSIIWRQLWEESRRPELKAKLIEYNRQDCMALKRLCDFLSRVTSTEMEDGTDTKCLPKITNTNDLKQTQHKRPIFGKPNFLLEDFQHVNNCAYFDYQREKVFIRANKNFININKRINNKRRIRKRPNKCYEIHCKTCPRCRSRKIKQESEMSKYIIDLKFSKSGVKKWIIKYLSWKYECLSCKYYFISWSWPKSRAVYGHGLKSWCVYHNIARKQSMLQVSHAIGDLFEIYVHRDQLYRFKSSISEYYQGTYKDILKSIVNGSVLHIDETPVNLRSHKGYVWVITSLDRVYYFYKESREASFLTEMLRGFSGVLISDFYSAYDSVSCPQQKCLIHLIRDLNDDLRRNPFDDELKAISKDFGVLLRSIIDTIDRFGLKRRYLQKHKKVTTDFILSVCAQDARSKVAQKYQKRFKKSGSKFFTFLDYDGVPWNNNNAEHAMKWFAKYRRFADGLFSERTLSDFLIILSVFQSCEYNNVNVLQFLLSQETNIDGMYSL
jgi:predicted RecB family nuclease